jgi:hypothetical protein
MSSQRRVCRCNKIVNQLYFTIQRIKFLRKIIDTWDMTITLVQKKFSGRSLIELPSKPYMAIRIVKQK